jgi:prevent-host-death family protein
MSVGVGVRELKAHLSAHLARVKSGQTIVVTERGRPVAKLVPVQASPLPPHVLRMLETGEATWSGEPLPPFDPIPLKPGDKTLAEMVSEDRR